MSTTATDPIVHRIAITDQQARDLLETAEAPPRFYAWSRALRRPALKKLVATALAESDLESVTVSIRAAFLAEWRREDYATRQVELRWTNPANCVARREWHPLLEAGAVPDEDSVLGYAGNIVWSRHVGGFEFTDTEMKEAWGAVYTDWQAVTEVALQRWSLAGSARHRTTTSSRFALLRS